MPGYSWDFSFAWEYRIVFLRGIGYTLAISLVSMAVAIIVGLLLASGRLSTRKPIRYASTAVVELIRETPLLVHLLWIFYCVPVLIGKTIGAPLAAIVALSIYTSAYLAEIFRAGIGAIDRGQVDVARCLGMSHFQTFRRVVLPQALRTVIPPVTNQFAALIKYSSLASYLAIYELFKEAMNLSLVVQRPLEIYTATALMYFVPIFLCSMAARKLEARLRAPRVALRLTAA
jgi:polar amino acid transport system permease protein